MKKSKRRVKLTPNIIRKMVQEERSRMSETLEQEKDDAAKVDAEEVEAGDLASALEKDLDHLKALKITESKIKKTLMKIRGKKKLLLKT